MILQTAVFFLCALPLQSPTVDVVLKQEFPLPTMAKKEAHDYVRTEVEKYILDRLAANKISSGYSMITIEKIEQKNRSAHDILNSPAGPNSETKVKLIYRFNGTETKLEGKAKGPFFGTTERGEIGGAPKDRQVMIDLMNKQKVNCIARAVWDAVGNTMISQR